MTSNASSGRAADLIRRVRPIWPEPIDVDVRRSSRSGDRRDYLVLPALRRPVLLVPAAQRGAAGAILRFDDGQRAKLSLRLLAWGQAHGVLRRLPLARLSVGQTEVSGVLAAVEDAVPAAAAVVVRLGRPRHGRAVVLNALDAKGRSRAFGKCAWGERTADLRQERDNLVDVAQSPVPGIRAPEVLAFVELDDDSAALVLEALIPTSPAAGDPEVPVAAMQALASRKGWTQTDVASSAIMRRLREDIAELSDDANRGWLAAELDRLVAELGDVATRTGCWHGDFVPWNLARDGSTILLWDWEHHEDGVLPGFDHLHYLAQELRLRSGTTPDVEDTWLVAARRALAEHWDLSGSEAEAALRSYLLLVNLRFVADREGDPGGPVDRAGWARELIARLGPGVRQ